MVRGVRLACLTRYESPQLPAQIEGIGLKIYHICGCNLLEDQRCDLKGEWEERMDRALLGSFKRLPLVTSALSGA